jgi:hypothetical protein
MNARQPSFKLITAGNINIPTMINAIIRATLELRETTEDDTQVFRQIHIFHTEQSLQVLMSTPLNWQQALQHYSIPDTSLIHYVTDLEADDSGGFAALVEQLRGFVNPLDSAHYYIDLTNGLSALKSILAVFAFVLDIKNIYTLEVEFSQDRDQRQQQMRLFYHELEQQGVDIKYRKFPAVSSFDDFGKRNYTEILRYRQILGSYRTDLSAILPAEFSLDHLHTTLLSGFNRRLSGQVTEELTDYRHAVFSLSAGVEELANILLLRRRYNVLENKTLGQKLNDVRELFTHRINSSIDDIILGHLTKLLVGIRNDVVHPSRGAHQDQQVAAILSDLSAQLALAFFRLTIKVLVESPALEEQTDDQQLKQPMQSVVLYFVFDGNIAANLLEPRLNELSLDDDDTISKIRIANDTIRILKKRIQERTNDKNAVLWAEAGFLIFRCKYQQTMLDEIQDLYQEKSGFYSSIGYGPTLREAVSAVRLSQIRAGNNVIGVEMAKYES